MADHTPVPRLRGPSIKITSPLGLALWTGRSAFRYFVTGNPIDGRLRDNASWLHDATQDYRNGPVARYSRARWRRVARRNALVGVPAGLAAMEPVSFVVGVLPGAPSWTEWPWADMAQGYVCTLAGVGLVWIAPRARQYYALRELRREVIHPATRVACQILGQRWDRRTAGRMLELSPGFGEAAEDAEAQPYAVLHVPPVALDPNVKKRIVSNVGARLGLPDASGEWQEFGGRAWVRISGADVPPRRIELSDVLTLDDSRTSLRSAIETSPMERPVVGIASGGRIITADFDNDSPHLAASGGTGTGKSTLFREILCQRMRNGSGVLCLDFKGISHGWLRRLPRTRALYFHRIEDIHEAAVAVGAELFARREAAVAAQVAGLPVPDFRTLDVLVEEANSLIADLIAYWTARRAEIKRENKAALELDPDADVTEPPVRSPAVDALGFLINMGRELKMHAHYAGQRLDASVFGGQGAARRASFQTRFLAKWDRASWRMLCSDVPYRVCPSGPRGIWAHVSGDRVDMIRVPKLSDDDAVSVVQLGPDPGTPVLSMLSGHAPVIEGELSDPLSAVRGVRVKLSDAVSRLPGERLSIDAIRKAAQRPGFPEPVERSAAGHLYDLAELIEWRTGRVAIRS